MDCGILPGREICELKQKALAEIRIEHIGLDMTRYKCLIRRFATIKIRNWLETNGLKVAENQCLELCKR